MDIDKILKDKLYYENRLTNYTKILKSKTSESRIEEFANLRNYRKETVEQADISYIGEMAEMLLPQYIENIKDFGVISNTNGKPIYNNRWVIPIKNEKGLVQGLVGYSPTADERYIYSTSKYYDRRDTLYGLENLNSAYELGWAILVEGITDCLAVRNAGFINCFATCGTHKSAINMKKLNRCRYGIINVHDRDSAGNNTRKHWIVNKYVTLNVHIKYKDVDEMISDKESLCDEISNVELFKMYVDSCLEWLTSFEHKGFAYKPKEITII